MGFGGLRGPRSLLERAQCDGRPDPERLHAVGGLGPVRSPSDKHRFLKKYYDLEHDEPVLELTYDTERVLEWVLSLERKDFVGTESRFLLIIETLRKLGVSPLSLNILSGPSGDRVYLFTSRTY